MNENIDEIVGQDSDVSMEHENELEVLEDGETTSEAGEGSESTEETGDSESGTVSGGDSVNDSLNTELLQELVTEVGEIKDVLPELVAYEESKAMTIWEKPLSDYNTLEGLGLITLILLLAVVIFGMVGRIIKCRI